jgi:hypothetical protein
MFEFSGAIFKGDPNVMMELPDSDSFFSPSYSSTVYSYSFSSFSTPSSFSFSPQPVGIYTKEERRLKIARFKRKKHSKISPRVYRAQDFARRPRFKGRFIKITDSQKI